MRDASAKDLEIPFLRARFPDGLQSDLANVLQSGYVGAGDLVASFERALQNYLGAPSIVATSSCTAALTLAYVNAGIEAGSRVLSTPMTCAATNIPLLQLGAVIGWLDVDPSSGNVTAQSIASGLHRHPDARAVVVMDWGGTPCDYARIAAECRTRRLPLVLDAAQSFGSLYAGMAFPTGVDYVCYSFGPTKLFSTIEGGAVAFRSSSASRIEALRWYGIRRENRDALRFWEYEVTELGYRFTSNNVFAAVGMSMLPHVEARLRLHRALAQMYDTLLNAVAGVNLSVRPPESEPSYWLYTVLVENREQLIRKLHSHGVHAATPHRRNDILLGAWTKSSPADSLPGVSEFDAKYLCLPIGPWVHGPDLERVCRLIREGW